MLPYYVTMNTLGRGVALTAGTALCYFLLGKLGLASALPPGFVSAIWPAAGFAFAVTVLWGVRATALGIFLGSLATNATVGGGFHLDAVAACIAAGSTLQAAVGGAALMRLMPNLELNDPRTVMRFSLLGVASCLIAATVGNLTLIAHGFISWAQVPQSFTTWWMGDAFGVQIFAPLTLVVLAPNAIWKQRRTSVGVPLLVAFLLSCVIYLYVRESDERQLQRDFVAAMAPFEHELRSMERSNGQAMRQLAASYRVRGEAPGPEFRQMAAEILASLPDLQAISWAPVLDAAGQAAYARKVQGDGSVKPVNWPKGFQRSADGLVAPVTMMFPMDGNEMALGVDLMGESTRATALRKALVSDQLTITSPLHLMQDPNGPGAMLLMAPISNAATQGVVTGVINLRFVDSALQSTPGVVWELREVRAGGVGEKTTWKSSKLTMPDFVGNTSLDRLGVYSQQHVTLGGKEWHMLLHIPHARLVANSSNSPLLVLMMALFACAILANFVLMRSGEQERIRAEVLEKTSALNAEIAERMAYQDALEQSKLEAESANLAKSQFLATMSHELRTPMNGILGMAQLLMMEGLTEFKRNEFVRTILGSGQSLLAILNDILDLSKIEAGKMELNVSPFDALALVEDVAALFRESAKAKGLVLVVQVVDTGARHMGDPIRLRQMLSNYVGNAIKFSEKGEIAIELAEGVNAQGDTTLEFSVRDQGMGINESKLSSLFNPFVQADASATRRFGGTGLGLSIVRSLAIRMQGDVGVFSRVGEGSRFWFTVRCPREVRDTPLRSAIPEYETTAPANTDVNANAHGNWVLVVDDNAINRMVAHNMLLRLGVQVRCVEDGQQALDLLQAYSADPPILVLMDCQMPVMDGYTATRTLRAKEQASNAPRQRIVALTAGAFESDRQQCLDSGMDDYVAKPLAFDQLAQIVNSLIT